MRFLLYTKKMKRKRLEMEYTLVDEYLNQREADVYNKLKKMKEPTPKKPLLKSQPKINVTRGNRKSNT